MHGGRKLALCVAVLVLAVLVLSTAAWARVDLYKGNSGEAAWAFAKDYLDLDGYTELCASDGTDYCAVADYWNVELRTWTSTDDWAYLALDAAQRPTVSMITDLGFTYKMFVAQPNSGPRMGLSLVDAMGNTYLALSEGAPVQTTSCDAFNPAQVNWVWGTWSETTDDGITRLDPTTFVQAGTGSYGAMAITYATYKVQSVIVLMGVTKTPGPGDIGTGQAVIDRILLRWTDDIAYGGTYMLENAGNIQPPDVAGWPNPFTFDDGNQTPLPGSTDKPYEFQMWCQCEHCLKLDDSNLWGVVSESDVDGVEPDCAIPFKSSSYALYFGDPAQGNYDTGDVAVGAICSTFNELNPGDKYVSVSFSYFREVEQYVGPFDWTYVQIKFYDADGNQAWTSIPHTTGQQVVDGWYYPFEYGLQNVYKNPGDVHPLGPAADSALDPMCSSDDWGWKTIWYRDATDPNELGWMDAVATHYLNVSQDPYSEDLYRIKIPPTATRMKIRFCFNSVDGANNSSFGWLVDNIGKSHSPDPTGCKIQTATLPQAKIGVKYDFWLEPNCQSSPKTVRSYTLVDVEKDGESLGPNLPLRLALDSCGRIYGTPDPGTSGTYILTLRLSCLPTGSDTKELVLNIRSPGEPGETQSLIGVPGELPENFGGQTSSLWRVDGSPFGSKANCPNLWHEAHFVKYALDTTVLQDEYGSAAYFGQDDSGIPYTATGYDPNFQCSRAKGCLMSPLYQVIEPTHDGQPLVIGFKSWRNVEYFTGGEFDETKVEVRREGQSNWTEVWRKTSKDVSLAAWEWVEIHTDLILKYGQKIQVRFCFDSVDAYGNRKEGEAYGWLIDEVSLYAGSPELGISNCPREETSVGDYYKEKITATGGTTSSRLIWEISQGELPIGLALSVDPDDCRTAYVEGIPREATRGQEFTIRVRTQDWSQAVTRTCTIVVGEDVTLLAEDFENDPTWSLGGLWHFTADCGAVGVPDLGPGNHAAYYGRQDCTTPNYNTGAVTSGMLTVADTDSDLPGNQLIDITGVTGFKIEFKHWREVESFGGQFDKTQLQVKLGAGDWKTVWKLDSSTTSTEDWETVQVGPYQTGGATTLSIRFLFDSVDKWYNNYVGWLVDDVKVQSATGGIPVPTLSVDRLEARDNAVPSVMNIPNPVEDVHTTTFTVRSDDVDAIRIEIYDLSGSKVFEEEIAGNELVWHTQNDFGEYLANGIYIYRAYVLMNGEWIPTSYQKLVILR